MSAACNNDKSFSRRSCAPRCQAIGCVSILQSEAHAAKCRVKLTISCECSQFMQWQPRGCIAHIVALCTAAATADAHQALAYPCGLASQAQRRGMTQVVCGGGYPGAPTTANAHARLARSYGINFGTMTKVMAKPGSIMVLQRSCVMPHCQPLFDVFCGKRLQAPIFPI